MKWLSFANVILMSFFLGWQVRRVAVEADNRQAVCRQVVCVEADMPEDRYTRIDTVAVSMPLDDWQILQMAIAFTESRFDPDAVGKAHDSGILQLTPIYVAEVNRVAGTDYTLQDAFDIEKALEIFETMQAVKNPTKDIETAIRYHNKAGYYRSTVLRNMTFIRNYEAVRAAVEK